MSSRVSASHPPASLIEKRGAGRGAADVEGQDEDFGRALHLLEFREQGRPALQLRGERFDRAEGRGTDVVLHPFDVVTDDLFVEAEQGQKIGQELMPPRDVAGEGFAGRSQNQAAILFVFQEAFAVQPLNHVADAGLRNIEAGRDVDDAGVALGINQFENSFEVILDRGGIALRFFRGHGSGKVSGLQPQVKIKVFGN